MALARRPVFENEIRPVAPRPAHGREEGGLDRHLGDADLQDSRRREPLNIAIDRIARRDISFIVIVARPAEFSQ